VSIFSIMSVSRHRRAGALALLGACSWFAIAGTSAALERARVSTLVTPSQVVEFNIYLPTKNRAAVEAFLNELIWAYDYGAKPRRRWPAKHETILVYVRTPGAHHFDADGVDREPYMAPGLVDAEKARRGKRPTDVWFHTIVPTNGSEKTGYPTQKPEGVLRRIVAASSRPGGWCLDPFAGSGTLGAVCQKLGRPFVLIDSNPVAIETMRERLSASPQASEAAAPARR